METTFRDIGVDFHSDKFTADFFDGQKHNQRTYLLSERQQFYSELRKTDSFTIETLTGSFNFVREMKNLVSTCNIVNPSKLNISSVNRNKTDSIDARYLAEVSRISRMHVNDCLARVYLVSPIISELRSLFGMMTNMRETITAQKNRIHCLLKENLMPHNGKEICSCKIRKKILALSLPEAYMFEIRMHYDILDMYKKQKEALEVKIKTYVRHFPKQTRRIVTIPGMSVLTALAIIAEYGGDLDRFSDYKRFCSYLGTAPLISESNGQTKIRHVNKASRRMALGLVLQGIHHTWKDNSQIAQYRSRKKSLGMGNGKLRVAIARKLFETIYFMLKKDEDYRYKEPRNTERKIKEIEKYERLTTT